MMSSGREPRSELVESRDYPKGTYERNNQSTSVNYVQINSSRTNIKFESFSLNNSNAGEVVN